MKGFALALLVVGLYAEFSWLGAPEDLEVQGQVYNVGQGLLILLLLAALAQLARSRVLAWVCALLGAFAALAAGCSLAWLASPWPLEPNADQCSARLHIPLGLLGLAGGLLLLGWIVKGKRDGQSGG